MSHRAENVQKTLTPEEEAEDYSLRAQGLDGTPTAERMGDTPALRSHRLAARAQISPNGQPQRLPEDALTDVLPVSLRRHVQAMRLEIIDARIEAFPRRAVQRWLWPVLEAAEGPSNA